MKQTNSKPHIIVTAGLISKAGKFLISKRPEGCHLAGFWEFPGGKQEKNETLEECLKREIREELDIEIHIEKKVMTVHHEYDTKKVTLHFFNCTSLRGPLLARECQEIRWVDRKDLNKYRFPPPDLDVIQIIAPETMTREEP